MAKHTVDRDLGLKRILSEMAGMDTLVVSIGVHEGERNSEGLNVAEYAAHNEYGTKNIPERSFMRSTFDEKQSSLQNAIAYRIRRIGIGKKTAVQSLAEVGEMHQQDIQLKIKNGPFKENAAYTIKKKKSDKPLIDTGALVQSIRYVVHK